MKTNTQRIAAITYRPDIDGLRAIAILAVMGYHYFPNVMTGGFAGVDVFFVISGYLITSIIHEECKRGSFSCKQFYLRRVKRLFPAMACVLLAILAAGTSVDSFNQNLIRRSVTWVLLFSSNVFIWRGTGDYWAPGVEDNPLLHTWSLAVEEQFYLVFPLMLAALWKWRPSLLFRWISIMALASFICCVVGTSGKPAASFYLLPTRAWELLLGCLLAIFPPMCVGKLASAKHAGIYAGVGLGMIAVMCFFVRGGADYPGYKAALPSIGAAIVIAFAGGAQRHCVTRMLQEKWMVLIGKISYSLYLWHWPVLVYLRKMQEHPVYPVPIPLSATGYACIIISFILSIGCYLLVEKPFRRWNYTPMLCGGLLAFLLMAVGLGNAQGSRNSPQAGKSFSGFQSMTVKGGLYSVNQVASMSKAAREKYKYITFVYPEKPASLDKGVIRKYGTEQIDVLMLGDSHSLMFAPMVDEILLRLKISGAFFCADAVAPDLFRKKYKDNESFGTAEECKKYDDVRRRFIEERKPKVVLWIQRYDERRFEEMRQSIQYIVERSNCIFVQQPPVLNIGDHCTVDVFGSYRDAKSISLENLNIVEKQEVKIRRNDFETRLLWSCQEYKTLKWFKTCDDLLKSNGGIKWWDGNSRLYYIDDDHLSEYGVQIFRDRLQSMIMDAVGITNRNAL